MCAPISEVPSNTSTNDGILLILAGNYDPALDLKGTILHGVSTKSSPARKHSLFKAFFFLLIFRSL